MSIRPTARMAVFVLIVVAALSVGACSKKQPPVARPAPPPPPTTTEAARPPAPPEPVPEPTPVPVPEEPVTSEDISNRSLDEINRNSPLQPVFFGLDSSDVDDQGQQLLQANAEVLRRYPDWQLTIEGHCDERGTAEYNLALGERRAIAARNYLVSLGIDPDRLKTVSYGKEFPFDPGHTESAWAKNRRAHFVVTAK